jgi:uncharacterized MnhB-related membrane protein
MQYINQIETKRILKVNELSWTRLGLTLYIFAIINLCYAFYSVTEQNLINSTISLATYLVLVIASAHLEEETR